MMLSNLADYTLEPSGIYVLQPARAKMNDFAGVVCAGEAARVLGQWGIEPLWHDDRVAFGGAAVWVDTVNGLVASGELELDNEAELRQSLGLPKASPGELALELYRCYGPNGPSRLLGMFALAIWDSMAQRLTLWRDGVGARVLYYAQHRGNWWFATRLRIMRRSPAVTGNISALSIRRYLTFSYVPGATTMWQDVCELRPGHRLELPSGSMHSFWEPVEQRVPIDSFDGYAARLRALLEHVVRDMTAPEGPLVVFLSGGIDSSLVAAIASRIRREPLHTIAIYFGSEHPHELEYSGLVARHLQTKHLIMDITPHDIQDNLEETMVALDDPIGDPLTVPNFLMARRARQLGQHVLNGEGGDPCFGGPKNVPMILSEPYDTQFSRETNYLRAYRKCYDELPVLLSGQIQAQLREMETDEEFTAPFLRNPAMAFLLNRLMYANVRLKGADHILTKVNNLTTANDLIGRSPLFDQRVVDFSFAIPPTFKVSGKDEKLVLKKAVHDLLPEAIVKRPKSGMRVPVQSWFRNDLQSYARGLLLSRSARIKPYINQSVIKEWLSYGANVQPKQGAKLWQILSLEMWLRVNE